MRGFILWRVFWSWRAWRNTMAKLNREFDKVIKKAPNDKTARLIVNINRVFAFLGVLARMLRWVVVVLLAVASILVLGVFGMFEHRRVHHGIGTRRMR